MSRRRKRGARAPRGQNLSVNLAPETRQGIAVIFFFAFAAILVLSLLGMASDAGTRITHWLAFATGSAKALVPLFFAGLGLLLLIPKLPGSRSVSVIGMLLFMLAATGGLTIVDTANPQYNLSGGWLGAKLAEPLVAGFDSIAALIIFIAICLAALFLIFHTSFAMLAEHGRGVGRLLIWPLRAVWSLQHLFARRGPKIHTEPQEETIAPEETDVTFEEPEFVTKEMLAPTKKTAGPAANAEFSEALHRRRSKPYGGLPLNLLDLKSSKPTSGDIKKNMEIIQKTFANFGIEVEMGDVSVGPTVTQFTLRPQEGIKLTKVTALSNDLALALAAHPIRMEAPIPGKSLVGIEVPNQTVATVGLREVLETQSFAHRSGNLTLVLGKDVAGKPWLADLPKLPHLLVAGATGSGKTVALNAFIISLLYQNSPDDLRLILIDPKRVELPIYNGIPHLLVPVITDVPKTVNALKWTIMEMERRFAVLEKFGARNIQSYNARTEEKMPAIVVVVDELADLMAASANEVEAAIIRVAQMARAVGIHLVLATQRPSVDVITGLIKANIPARIAFSVASQTDSRTILDAGGAEKLLGRGDMLYTAPELGKPKRIQGAFVSDEETKRIVEHLKSVAEAPDYDETITEKQRSATVLREGERAEDEDPLIPEAKEVLLRAGKASASLLQRRLRVGYARAARLLDLLEAEGFVGPADGAKPRDVLANGGDAVDENEVPPWA